VCVCVFVCVWVGGWVWVWVWVWVCVRACEGVTVQETWIRGRVGSRQLPLKTTTTT
jgi:hypothetical protein